MPFGGKQVKFKFLSSVSLFKQVFYLKRMCLEMSECFITNNINIKVKLSEDIELNHQNNFKS